jgi:hypothetical protein
VLAQQLLEAAVGLGACPARFGLAQAQRQPQVVRAGLQQAGQGLPGLAGTARPPRMTASAWP